ncbi:MAG TPA: SLC13 family permease [Egibacteraceae bacterium]|nr:SLC13 family permease [Egibacteraceae bacterium]
MTLDAWITLVVVVATIAALARDAVQPAVGVFGATVVLLVVGVLEPARAFSGFSNPAPITVGALFVLARAVETTGALEPLIASVMGAGKSQRGAVARIVAPTAAASAFLNNTPIVAMAAPQVAEWADQRGLPASRFLMPVSYAAILGGVVTLIGTSTNLVVHGLMIERGMPGLGMFELSRVGLPIAVVGCGIITLLSIRLLPDRRAARDSFDQSIREFTMAMRVVAGGPMDGKTIEEGGLRHLESVFCVRVDRSGHVIAPVGPSEVLRGDDVLTFVGKVDQIVDLQRRRGLVSTEEHHLDRLGDEGNTFYEAVIGPQSPLVGQTLRQAGFRKRYQAAVLAIHRAGQRMDAKLGDVPLRVGDTLLLLAETGWRQRWRESGDFLLVARLSDSPRAHNPKAVLVGVIALGLVVLASTGILPILEASLGAALLLIAVGALTPRQARQAVDIDVLVVIAAAFGLGAAVADSGLGDVIADGILTVFSPLGALGALAGVLLATMLLTELVTNNAAAVLAFPIAMSTASALGANPRGFAIAVALGASLSFLTPIGYQTNLMVYGLGGYRFSDYARLGVPINIVVIALALLIIPLAWPF